MAEYLMLENIDAEGSPGARCAKTEMFSVQHPLLSVLDLYNCSTEVTLNS